MPNLLRIINFSENDGQRVSPLFRQFYYVLLFSSVLVNNPKDSFPYWLQLSVYQHGSHGTCIFLLHFPPSLSLLLFSLLLISPVSGMHLECPTLCRSVPLAMTWISTEIHEFSWIPEPDKENLIRPVPSKAFYRLLVEARGSKWNTAFIWWAKVMCMTTRESQCFQICVNSQSILRLQTLGKT